MNFSLAKTNRSNPITSTLAAVALGLSFSGVAVADSVTVVSWGGAYGKAQDLALFNDASKNSGIAINRESGASMSKVDIKSPVSDGMPIQDGISRSSSDEKNIKAQLCL